jgi:hypothetical protein
MNMDKHGWPVVAGVPPAVEPGILLGGTDMSRSNAFKAPQPSPGRQDAALYGRRDAYRYSRHPHPCSSVSIRG